MKITRDFTHGAFGGKKGESLDESQMRSLGSDNLTHLRDVAGVIEGDIPDGIATGLGATASNAISADEALAQGHLDSSSDPAALVPIADGTGDGTGATTKAKTGKAS